MGRRVSVSSRKSRNEHGQCGKGSNACTDLKMATSTNPLHGADHYDQEDDTKNDATQRGRSMDPSNIWLNRELKTSLSTRALVSIDHLTMYVPHEYPINEKNAHR